MSSFRPLTGIIFLFNPITQASIVSVTKRFRPLTGIIFLFSTANQQVKCSEFLCFRPLTGIIFLFFTADWLSEHCGVTSAVFPSPYGDYFFILVSPRSGREVANQLFPSPYGDYFFIHL